MSYVINKTDGGVLTTIQDGTTDASTGLTLIGRNYISYGEVQNENFVRLLESFADTIPPGQSVGFNPMVGTIWYDTANQRIRAFDGTNWTNVSGRISSNVAPTTTTYTLTAGDQWWDTANSQLRSWDGTAWQLVGPAYTKSQGKSGPVVETIRDSYLQYHTVVNTYTNGNLISITSYDNEFTPSPAITGITNISPGINLINTEVLNGTANNSVRVGGVFANALARIDRTSSFSSDVIVGGTLSVGGFGNVSYSSQTLTLENTAYQGNIEVYVNSNFGKTLVLNVNGADGTIRLPNDPSYYDQIARKNYVDTVATDIVSTLNANVTNTNNRVTQLRIDTSNYINSNINALTATVNNNQTLVDNNLSAIGVAITALQATDASQQGSINSINSALVTTNQAIVTANLQMKGYVDSLNASMVGNLATLSSTFNSSLTGLAVSTAANLTAATSTLAPLASPVLTGSPRAPTQAPGTNDTTIATTAFVKNATANQLTSIVRNYPPVGTPTYDFWFQV